MTDGLTKFKKNFSWIRLLMNISLSVNKSFNIKSPSLNLRRKELDDWKVIFCRKNFWSLMLFLFELKIELRGAIYSEECPFWKFFKGRVSFLKITTLIENWILMQEICIHWANKHNRWLDGLLWCQKSLWVLGSS